MKNGKTSQLSNKRQAIYKATLEVCHSRGIGNATTLEIARKAGIAAGTLFCYYATKYELLNAIYKTINFTVIDFVLQSLADVPEYNKEGQLRRLWLQACTMVSRTSSGNELPEHDRHPQ